MTFPSFTRTIHQLQSIALALQPHGGQGTARRNAWAAMSDDATVSRARRDAAWALDLAVHRARQAELRTS